MQDIRRNAAKLEVRLPLSPVTGVRFTRSGKDPIFSGSETGRVLEMENPTATQEMADALLMELIGQTSQGYNAEGVQCDIATELGDDVLIDGVVRPVDILEITFGPVPVVNLGSPGEAEVTHEIPFRSKKERQQERREVTQERATAAAQATADTVTTAVEMLTGIDELKNWDPATGVAVAETALYATIIDSGTGQVKTARISGAVVRDANGNMRSLANILADVITLKGEVNVEGNLYMKDGNIYSDKGLLVKSVAATNVFVGTEFRVGGRTYSPKSITSTTGPVTVLGA